MKIALLGFAAEGKAAYEYWNHDDNEITICDADASIDVPKDAESRLGSEYLKNLDGFDLLVRTPALHPADILKANPEAEDILNKVTSVTNEFFRVVPTKNLIGVTGTKGKGTTSTLIAKILEVAGKRVHLGGNIGLPLLDLLKKDIRPDDWVVMELSNFQLIDLKYSPHIAVCLMVEHEHLDWHEDHDEYITAKQQLFISQGEQDIAIYFAENENSETIADASAGKQIPYFAPPGAIVKDNQIVIDNQAICKTSEIKLLGQHNWQNVCAAVTTAWQISQDIEQIRSAITNFSGLPFRIEFRAEKNGVRYYNDSFSTAADSCLAAINSILEPKVMIVGGYERGLDLTGMAEGLKKKEHMLRHVLLIGQSAERVAENFSKAGFTNFTLSSSKTMPDIVREATALAEPGDAVVLSPGFASFDMFKNFEERGMKFNEAVAAL